MSNEGDYGDGGRLDARRLWAGAVVSAVIASLVAVAGILVARGLLDVPLLAPRAEGVWGSVSTGAYALAAAVLTLAAAGIMQLLWLVVPRPTWYFGWLVGLATLIGMVAPLSLNVEFGSKVATATMDLVMGIVVSVLITSTARSARTFRGRR
jgi:hypothetical protein